MKNKKIRRSKERKRRMRLKDKITPELNAAFVDNIAKTKTTHREHGFHLCIENDKLFPSKIKCEGTICSIVAEIKPDTCPGKIQGFFHAHPQKPLLEILLDRKITDEEIKQKIMEGKKRFMGITVQTPSHRDVLSAFLDKCKGNTEGTACTGSDLETDKIECWTPKENATNFLTCSYAKIDSAFTRKIGDVPKKWIRNLSNIEQIQLEE